MDDKLNITQSLLCNSCNHTLSDPITLSCGYTICAHCFPVRKDFMAKETVFLCPIPQCNATTHLFGPQVAKDDLITLLVHSLRHSIIDGPPSPPSKGAMNVLDPMTRTILPLLKCSFCHDLLSDPITTPCGHTFCRFCVLQFKIESDVCKTCTKPLPKYQSLSKQSPNYTIARIIKNLETSGSLLHSTHQVSGLNMTHLHYANTPLFLSGKVILPGQHTRIAIPASSLHIFRHTQTNPSQNMHLPCLAAVHRDQPQVAHFGTVLEVIDIERQDETLFVDVLGIERLRLENHEEIQGKLVADFDVLNEATLPALSIASSANESALQRRTKNEYAMNLAGSILQAIQYLGQPQPMPNVLHSQTKGLLGPIWLENMKSQHGPMPPSTNPAAVVWWAAAALPIPDKELYMLLRTLSIIDRLELIISWIQTLQNQWSSCRERAIQAFSQVPQEYEKML